MFKSLRPLQFQLNAALNNLNQIFNKVTQYTIILDKKNEIVVKERELLDSKQRFTMQKSLIEQKEQELVNIRKDFELQKELNNIELMPRLYSKQLGHQNELKALKNTLNDKWNEFENRQFEYFNLTRQLMQEENIYIYKVRRLGLFYNWVFISIHLLVFVVVQMNERKKRHEILMEIQQLKSEMVDFATTDIANENADSFQNNNEEIIAGGDHIELEPIERSFVTMNGKWSSQQDLHFWQGLAAGCMSTTVLYIIQNIIL